MKKTTTIVVAASAAILAIGGGVGIAAAANIEPAGQPPSTAPLSASTGSPIDKDRAQTTTTPASGEDPTTSGEVCDPSSLNDMICLAFYPDTAVANMTSGLRAQEPLRTMNDTDKIALAHKACDTFDAGGSPATVTLIGTDLDADKVGAVPADINNTNIFQIGALAYCHDHIVESDGTHFRWTIEAYQGMGESAAKASFAGGHVIQP